MLIELILLTLLAFLIYHLFFEFDYSKLPPGPRPWPLVGNAFLMNSRMHLCFTDLEKKFGNVFRVYMGHRLMVVLSGEAIRNALVQQPKEFADRPSRSLFRFKEHRSPALFLMEYGETWRLFRKLGHSTIKVYGENRLEKVIHEEVEELCKRLEGLEAKAMDISTELGISITNVICNQLFGTRYDINDQELIQVHKFHDLITRVQIQNSFLDFFPILMSFLPISDGERQVEASAVWRDNLLKRKYLDHLETFDPDNLRDYTDALLKAKMQAEEEDKSSKEHLTEEAIIMAGLATLFLAGSETTSTTLSWAVAYLLHNPKIQERIQQEIDEVVGRDEVPTLKYKKQLPLLEAFIAESLRMSSLLPLSLPHKTLVDTTFMGYHLPKGTLIVPNLWSLHHDSTIWKDPFKFSLERFLNDEGKFVNPPGGTLLPFGAGPRMCMGEVLARSELYLFLSRLLQKFKFENPPGADLPSLEGDRGVVMHPKPFKVCVKIRD